MIKIASRKEVSDYYNSSALSQSEMKLLLYGVSNYNNKKDFSGTTESQKIGSAIDLILTGEEKDFEELYFISKLAKLPSDKVKKIVENVRNALLVKYANFNGDLDDNSITKIKSIDFSIDVDELILDSIYKEDYYNNRTDAKRLEGVKKEGSDYFYDLINSLGKVVLSVDEKTKIDKVVKSVREHPSTKKYFDREAQEKFGKVTFHYQYPIYFEYNGVACKCLLDLCIFVFNKQNELIVIEPVDFKSTYEETHKFQSIARKYRYDIQAAWYTEALTKAFTNFPNVKIKPFKFIVESTTSPGQPIVWIASESFLEIGRKGRKPVYLIDTNFTFDGENAQSVLIKHPLKGFEDLFDDYIYYSMNGFDKEREVNENDNILTLDFE